MVFVVNVSDQHLDKGRQIRQMRRVFQTLKWEFLKQH